MIWLSIITAAAIHNIDVAELHGLIMVESSGCKNIVSIRSSALGCGQITRATAKHYGLVYNRLKDHDYAISATARILASLKKRFPRSYLCVYTKGPSGYKTHWNGFCKQYILKIKQFKKEYENEKVKIK